MFNIVGYVIAGIDLFVCICILIMTLVIAHRLKGSVLQWSIWFFLITGMLYAAHAWIEITHLSEELYGLTALIAILMLGFTLIIIDITTRILGVKT